MANEKVDLVIVGAGASGSVFASVMAKAGKKVVLLEQGPDWQLGDLISSDIWGRRIKPAGPPFLLEGKNPYGYVYQAGWGVGGAALHYFANFPRLMPNDFKVKTRARQGAGLADRLFRPGALLGPGRARRRGFRRRQGRGNLATGGRALSDAANEDLRGRRGLEEGICGRRHKARARRRRHQLDRIQGPAGLHL